MARISLCLLALLALTGCESYLPIWETGSKPNLEDPKQPVNPDGLMLLSADWVNNNIQRGDLAVVHVGKDRQGYDRAHLPGAHFVAWADLTTVRGNNPNALPSAAEFSVLIQKLGISTRDYVVVYDDEQGLMAARFYLLMDLMGLGNHTSMMDGQLARWRNDFRPVTTQPAEANLPQSLPVPHNGILASMTELKDISAVQTKFKGAKVAIVDARSPEEFAGTTPGEGVQRSGHVPGAVNVPWSTNLRSKANPMLLSKNELIRLYATKGVHPDDQVITYCRSGVQAGMSYFVLKYLGYRVSYCDGSYMQWSQVTDLPVAKGPDTTPQP